MTLQTKFKTEAKRLVVLVAKLSPNCITRAL